MSNTGLYLQATATQHHHIFAAGTNYSSCERQAHTCVTNSPDVVETTASPTRNLEIVNATTNHHITRPVQVVLHNSMLLNVCTTTWTGSLLHQRCCCHVVRYGGGVAGLGESLTPPPIIRDMP